MLSSVLAERSGPLVAHLEVIEDLKPGVIHRSHLDAEGGQRSAAARRSPAPRPLRRLARTAAAIAPVLGGKVEPGVRQGVFVGSVEELGSFPTRSLSSPAGAVDEQQAQVGGEVGVLFQQHGERLVIAGINRAHDVLERCSRLPAS
jgi:hypothetical protein